jgi:hypothetical protein
MTRKRGSIALARQLCYEIAGATSEDDDTSGSDYGSVDVAEILSAEVERLREELAREHAMHDLARLGQEIEQEPSQWREMIVVSLVREGIDKHRARELADHFAAQRPWQGLTDEEMTEIVTDIDVDWGDLLWKVVCLTKIIEAKLKERNK